MVTGIETAGLVLASLPLITQALLAYKVGFEETGTILGFKQKKYKLKVERLRLRLEGQSVSLHLSLTKLIGRAAPDEDITHLPVEFNDMIWSGSIAEKIKVYLGLSNAYEAFQRTLSLYQSYLEEIAAEIVGISRPPNADQKDLEALLITNVPEHGRYQFRQRLNFVMNEARVEKLLRDLSDSTLTIKNFIDDNEDLHQIQRSRQEPQEAKQKNVTRSLHTVRKHASALGTLFRAMLSGWNQSCHERHDAMICLEHRCQDGQPNLQGSRSTINGTYFTLLLSWQHQTTSERSSWHETSVVTVEEDSHMLLSRNSVTSRRQESVTTVTTPSVVITPAGPSASGMSNPTEITSICKALTETRPRMFQLSSDNKLFCGVTEHSNAKRLTEQGQRTISLSTFLVDHRHMDPDDRIKLAVNLASSLLQYNCTPWLTKCWTKRTIHFLTQVRAVSGIDVEHPLVHKQFYKNAIDPRYDASENDPEIALMELGILLLEIWNMETFESWLSDMGHSVDAHQLQDTDFRLRYSIKWFKNVKSRLLPNYCEVVGICLRPSAFDLFETSWENDEFRITVYKKIVEPLLIWNK